MREVTGRRKREKGNKDERFIDTIHLHNVCIARTLRTWENGCTCQEIRATRYECMHGWFLACCTFRKLLPGMSKRASLWCNMCRIHRL